MGWGGNAAAADSVAACIDVGPWVGVADGMLVGMVVEHIVGLGVGLVVGLYVGKLWRAASWAGGVMGGGEHGGRTRDEEQQHEDEDGQHNERRHPRCRKELFRILDSNLVYLAGPFPLGRPCFPIVCFGSFAVIGARFTRAALVYHGGGSFRSPRNKVSMSGGIS